MAARKGAVLDGSTADILSLFPSSIILPASTQTCTSNVDPLGQWRLAPGQGSRCSLASRRPPGRVGTAAMGGVG